MTDPLVGSRFDRYELVRELGRGGMAVVYEARHAELGSRHAIKLFDSGIKGGAARLVREGQLQARLSHPNLVAVTDVIEVEGRPGLVLEFVDGVPLDDWLADHPDVDGSVRRRLFCQILAAVGHAHAAGTIHRDLKPANVLVSGTVAEPWAKVADFGLAKALRDDTSSATRPNIPMGTPRYMAPEQIRDARSVDERADVFALGCLLAELWTGQPMFEGESFPEIFESILAGEFELPPGLPRDVAAAVRGALHPDRDQRTPSVAALAAQLACDAPTLSVAPAASPTLWMAAGLGGLGFGGVAFAALVATLLCVGVGWIAPAASPPASVPAVSPVTSTRPRVRPAQPRPVPTPVPSAPKPVPSPAPTPTPAPAPVQPPAPAPSTPPRPDHADEGHGPKDDHEKKEKKDEKEGKGKGPP